MNQSTTKLPLFEVTLIAHQDDSTRLLYLTLTAAAAPTTSAPLPLRTALVIDRSGSMHGAKLDATKSAVAQFIRSLDTTDRVAVATYDDQIDLVSPMEAPSEALARKISSLEPGGYTNLYGGWVLGAKLAGKGGTVILLSDGMANAGRFTTAEDLAKHAAISYRKYGVTTTTIGVGQDYDEALMAGMARSGGGSHYFAHTAAAIGEAFSQERFSAGAMVLERVTIRCGDVTEEIGNFWGGETKKIVLPLRDLPRTGMTLRFTSKASGERQTIPLDSPTEFGYSEDARLELLLKEAAAAESEMIRVRDPRTAGEMRERMRKIILDILRHPSSDVPEIASVIEGLKASMERLQQLEQNYVEEDAMVHRKRSLQASHNLNEPAKAYSSFEDEKKQVREASRRASGRGNHQGSLRLSREAFALAPQEVWIKWKALPIEVTEESVTIALEDPRQGFVVKEIERTVGRPVTAVFSNLDEEAILKLLSE